MQAELPRWNYSTMTASPVENLNRAGQSGDAHLALLGRCPNIGLLMVTPKAPKQLPVNNS